MNPRLIIYLFTYIQNPSYSQTCLFCFLFTRFVCRHQQARRQYISRTKRERNKMSQTQTTMTLDDPPRSAVFLEKRVEKKSRWRDVKAKGKGHTGLTEGLGAGSLLSLDGVALKGDGEKRFDGLEVEKTSVPVWHPPRIGWFSSLNPSAN